MAVNNIGDGTFTEKLTCSGANQKKDLLHSRHFLAIISDGDCFINFDKDVTATGRFLIKADLLYELHMTGGVKSLNFLADSGTPALYVTASTQWRA